MWHFRLEKKNFDKDQNAPLNRFHSLKERGREKKMKLHFLTVKSSVCFQLGSGAGVRARGPHNAHVSFVKDAEGRR